MQRFRKVVDNDFIIYKRIYDTADLLLGLDKQESFIMNDGNQESIIFYCPPVFMKFWLDENNKIKSSTFYINDQKEIIVFTLDDYQVNINNEGIVFTHEDGNVYFLQLVKDRNEPGFEVENNGTLVFVQYDKKKDVRVISKFEHNVWCDNKTIYSGRLDNPFSITIESRAHLRDKGLKFIGSRNTYYKLDFDVYKNRWQYDLATAKDFGVGAVIANDTYSLQDKTSFSKYYKVLFSFGDYITITGFPFTRQYDMEEIRKLVKDLGFSNEVLEFFLNVYNNRNNYQEENRKIIEWYLNNVENNHEYSKTV